MSEQDIQNDATPEAVANAVDAAMAEPDTITAEGSSSDASPEAQGESLSESGGPSGSQSGPSSQGGSGANMGADVVMDALTGMARGQTLAKKQGMVSAGLMKKAGATASLLGTSALTGGTALGIGGLQIAATIIDSYTDRYRVRERGGQVQSAKDFAKGQGVGRATNGKVRENGQTLDSKAKLNKSHPRKKGPQTEAERVLGAHGRKAKAGLEGQRAGWAAGASLKSQSVQSPFANSRKAAVLGRYRSIQDKGHQGVQKDATFAPNAMGGKLDHNNTLGIRNDTQDALIARMTQLRPHQMKHQAPRPSF